MKRNRFTTLLSLAIALQVSTSIADWTRFRGPNGSGVASDNLAAPTQWSDTENILWKVPLPGPGSSSPIVTGEKVFITYWTGYGADPNNLGNMADLRIHLRCVNRKTGKTQWTREVKAKSGEQNFGGQFTQHGYASHTPVTDGQRVYAFFGRSGVHAFDLKGNPLWTADVGQELGQMSWGSASSPIISKSGLIIPATAENHALVALDKANGKVLWQKEAEGFGSTWGSPVIVEQGGQETVVLGVPNEVWALDAATGEFQWYSAGVKGRMVTGSVIVHDGVVYTCGSRGGGSIAIRAGGKGDVNESHVLWTGKDGSNIGTPIHHDGRLYWVASSIAHCRDAKTGEEIYAVRIPGPQAAAAGGSGRPAGRGGPGGYRVGGGMMNMDYASPVAAGAHWYQVTRKGETLVLKLGPKFEFVARNRLAADGSDFSATPAISKGQMFLRSYRNLYCIAE